MRLSILFAGLVSIASAVLASPLPAEALWPSAAPGALGHGPDDIPTLTPYPADSKVSSGAAMVICPGGGYGGLAAHEGNDYALFLNQHGITCFVLRYRLGSHGYRHPIMLEDAARAVRWVRSKAAEYRIDSHRVGIMGSSAGGHLASTLVTHFDSGNAAAVDSVEREGSRPDVGVLCYPVITMGEFTHQGSRQNLLGERPSADLLDLLSNEKQVTPKTPPCFVWHTWEDKAVPLENSLQFVAALQRNGVPFDFHVYQKGHHGIGLAAKPPEFQGIHPWAADLVVWLKVQGFVK